MPPVREATLPLREVLGHDVGFLRVRLRQALDSTTSPAPLVNDPDAEELEPVQLLEGHEYRYEVVGVPGPLQLEPAELFLPDDQESGLTGSLRPGLVTGRVEAVVLTREAEIGRASFEIRARKLDYLRHYRWMLRDIAEVMTEVVMERFAAAELRFAPDEARDAATLYQRFEFLRALLASDDFEGAIGRVLANPHVAWQEQIEERSPARGLRLTPSLLRQLVHRHPRTPLQGHPVLPSVPTEVPQARTEAVTDNPPNRFVKFALTRWRDVVLLVEGALRNESPSAPVRRGLREVERLSRRLDELLGEELFREVRPMVQFPAGDQVLQRREGYRQLLRAYVLFEIASKLSWPGGDDVYGAGQRNVAALYEFWTFLQLAKIVGEVCGKELDLSPLLQVDSEGMSVLLRHGRSAVVSGEVERFGRTLRLELWFNKTFSGGRDEGSWTRQMRPDAALRISAPGDPTFETVWLHFDAKYRIEKLAEIFGPVEDPDEVGVARSQATSGDLLKMHAYRDAIRRSAGAYVLYPGTKHKSYPEYREVLPGVGAFVLRPSSAGEAAGTEPLRKFLNDVMTHVGSQLTQHERDRFWRRASYGDAPVPPEAGRVASFLSAPPADTACLLGYVRSIEHLSWIHRSGLYNVRAGERSGAIELGAQELSSKLIVLYGKPLEEPEIWLAGSPRLLTRDQMVQLGYRGPRGEAYFCFALARRLRFAVAAMAMARLAYQHRGIRPKGAPVAVTWADVASRDG